jgi:predicted transcriptional regulator
MIQVDVLQFLIEKGPGRTELELARAIHGDKGYQQQVNQDLSLLLSRGAVERRDTPYRYFPT